MPEILNTTAINGLNAAARLLIVDDEPINIKIVRKYLSIAGYQNFTTITDSREALDTIRRQPPDVVLLDVMMPHVSGLEILQAIRADEALAHIPVLILTASTDAVTRASALEMGATDFLAKPIDASELVPRVRNALLVKAHQDHLARYSEQLECEVRLRTAELEASHLLVVRCLGRAAEYRDDDTGRHVVRVGRYASLIARELALDEPRVEMLELAAQLHDVGKIGIPDAILLKPGKLEPAEFEIMKKHCEYGRLIIDPIPAEERHARHLRLAGGVDVPIEYGSPLLKMAGAIALSHHERWDGSGYPNRLAAEAITLEGRITSVADVFDALCSKRPYKQPFPVEKALSIIAAGRGTQFDPQAVDAFTRRLPEVLRVQQQLLDAA